MGILLISSFLLAFLSHLFFFSEFLEGRYMTGLNDGLSQMIPFKYFLYNEYTNGNFFYSNEFGFGGGTFSQLGYYFSTSLVFISTVLFTYLLEVLHIIQKPDLLYWANAVIFISIIRLTLIITVTTTYFSMMKFKLFPAFIGASIYGTSIIYFRHVTYWEFFADAMLFLPLLLIGVEKIIRHHNPRWFIVVVSLSMIDNFYFAYVNFLLAAIYILFRWFFRLSENEVNKLKQTKQFLMSGLLGFGVSAVFFIPSVYGYLNNDRPPYKDSISMFGVVDNVLLNGRIVILPTFAFLCLFLFSFYRDRRFALFASLTGVLVILHYSPLVASLFNGFSAPQYRWEYFLSLAAGGLSAAGFQLLKTVKKRQLTFAIIVICGLYTLSYVADPKLIISSIKDSYMVFCSLIIICSVIFAAWKRKKWAYRFVGLMILITSLLTVNMFQQDKLMYQAKEIGLENGVSKEYMLGEDYFGVDQRKLVGKIQANESDPLARIDWMVPTRNNTPIVQDFKGMSVYSSILNKHLLSFYLNDLKIDMGRESVSRYASLGNRANLYGILNGKYYISENEDGNVPYGFSKYAKEGNYTAYKNNYALPFARVTTEVYSEKSLAVASALAKEQAMLRGIILENALDENRPIPESVNIISQTQVVEVNSKYEDDILTVTGKEGGLDIVVEEINEDIEDLFVSFYLKKIGSGKDYNLKVNDFVTERKNNESIYRTNVNDLTIRVANEKRISIRLPKGNYSLKDFELFGENYEVLKSAKRKSEVEKEIPVIWEGNTATLSYINDTGQKYLTVPIPYEKGWSVKINGEKQTIERANYAFTGIKLKPGINDVKFKYYPPFFFPALFLTLLSMLVTFIAFREKK
ncbi:YfhO family protein [Sporosarcina siberiensis]|uniref:YfhO family protein n=1 Tax=Sporosarcina siberiensis TaxID=1365606 RepID=A0ABW4SLX7_9BACL